MILEESCAGGKLCYVGHLGVIFVLEDAVYLIAPEGSDGVAHLGHGCVSTVGEGSRDIVSSFKCEHAVVVEGGVQAQIVAKVVADIVGPLEGHLDAGIEHFSIICEQGGHTAAGGHGCMEHNAVSDAVVEVYVAREAVLKECKVGTDVGLGHDFPFQIILVNRLCADAVHEGVTKHCRRVHSGVAGDIDVVCGDIVVTEHTPAGAQLEKVEGLVALHERLVGHYPAQAD